MAPGTGCYPGSLAPLTPSPTQHMLAHRPAGGMDGQPGARSSGPASATPGFCHPRGTRACVACADNENTCSVGGARRAAASCGCSYDASSESDFREPRTGRERWSVLDGARPPAPHDRVAAAPAWTAQPPRFPGRTAGRRGPRWSLPVPPLLLPPEATATPAVSLSARSSLPRGDSHELTWCRLPKASWPSLVCLPSQEG